MEYLFNILMIALSSLSKAIFLSWVKFQLRLLNPCKNDSPKNKNNKKKNKYLSKLAYLSKRYYNSIIYAGNYKSVKILLNDKRVLNKLNKSQIKYYKNKINTIQW